MTESESQTIQGERVRFIRSARLTELSIVKAGAVTQAFVSVLSAAEDLETPFRSTKGYADCIAALARLGECINRTADAIKGID